MGTGFFFPAQFIPDVSALSVFFKIPDKRDSYGDPLTPAVMSYVGVPYFPLWDGKGWREGRERRQRERKHRERWEGVMSYGMKFQVSRICITFK